MVNLNKQERNVDFQCDIRRFVKTHLCIEITADELYGGINNMSCYKYTRYCLYKDKNKKG